MHYYIGDIIIIAYWRHKVKLGNSFTKFDSLNLMWAFSYCGWAPTQCSFKIQVNLIMTSERNLSLLYSNRIK